MSPGRAAGRRAAGLLLLLGLAAAPSACALARVGPALGRLGEAGRARALLQETKLPGRTIHEEESQRCGVFQSKYFDEFTCLHRVSRFAVVRGSTRPVWAELNERLVLAEWTPVGGNAYSRRDFGGTLGLLFGEGVLHVHQPDATRAVLEQALAKLGPDEVLVGAVVQYSTPSDVLRSHTCYGEC